MQKQIYVVAGRYERTIPGNTEIPVREYRAESIEVAEALIRQLELQHTYQYCRIELRYPAILNVRALEKLTPIEFWSSVKRLAEMSLSEIKSLSLQNRDSQRSHLSAIASLSSQLREQGGYLIYPCPDTAESSSHIYGKDIS